MHHCLVLLLCTIFFVCRCVTLTLTAFFLSVKFVSSKKALLFFSIQVRRNPYLHDFNPSPL